MVLSVRWCIITVFMLALAGCGGSSSTVSGPAATDLQITSGSSSPVVLSWSAVASATSYKVYRDGLLVTSAVTPGYTDTAVTAGVHLYAVTWLNSTSESAPSDAVVVNIGGAAAPLPLSKAGLIGIPSATANKVDGDITTARFSLPNDIATDGSSLYVTDYASGSIRKISGTNVTTLALVNGLGVAVGLNGPAGIVYDAARNCLYVAIYGTSTNLSTYVAKIDLAAPFSTDPVTYRVTALAGTGANGSADGAGVGATFYRPSGLVMVGNDTLYVTDTGNHTVRKINLADGINTVTTIAGSAGSVGSANGSGGAARFRYPSRLTTDGTNLYLSDTGNHTIRAITGLSSATVNVFTIAGTALRAGYLDGKAGTALFNGPNGLACNGAYLYLNDSGNNLIRRIELATGTVTTVAGNVTGGDNTATVDIGAALFRFPNGMLLDQGSLYLADAQNNVVRRLF